MSTDAPHSTWWSLRGPAKKNGRNCPKIGVPYEGTRNYHKLVASYSKRLEVVIAAKGASTKYSAKAVNTYVRVIFSFFIFDTFAKNYDKILFLLCNYGVLSVDMREKMTLNNIS